VPTYDLTERFKRDFDDLSKEDQRAFRAAVKHFVDDLANDRPFRKALRVKRVEGTDVFEMTWEGSDGRATFEYGPEVRMGEPHIIWRRVGTHNIFKRP
jgi:mRNA-degrading endonuclease YafQ of YafQ-DinJ toxin-antitoxin module